MLYSSGWEQTPRGRLGKEEAAAATTGTAELAVPRVCRRQPHLGESGAAALLLHELDTPVLRTSLLGIVGRNRPFHTITARREAAV